MPFNANRKTVISQDNDPLSLFAPSDVEDELQGGEDNPLHRVMFVVNETEPQAEEQIGFSISKDILGELTEEFKNDELCHPKINPSLVNAINEAWAVGINFR